MHECPICGQACDCCGDDLWNDAEAANCEHDCGEMYSEDYDCDDADTGDLDGEAT